jgi:alpha-beta hydrolase superfamily lysophospholipase
VIPDLRLWSPVAGVFLALLLLWLIGDASYAFRVRRLSARPGSPRAAPCPLSLNRAGAPAVLLIHGFADGPSVFANLAPVLAGSDLAVHALHLPGSGVPPAEMAGLTLKAWRAAIDREIRALRTADPARPVWLLGHSLGGALAFDAALRRDNQVAGLVLLAPLVEVSRARSPLLHPRQWFAILDRLLIFTRTIESRLPKDLHDPAARATYVTDKYVHRDIYRALFNTVDAISERAADWQGPLFVAVSPTDQIAAPAAAARFFAAAVHARPARLVEQAEAGHVLPLDFGWETLAEQIARFIHESPANSPNQVADSSRTQISTRVDP